MKIHAIPVFVLMVSVLGFCVHKQAEIRKYEKIRHVLNEARDSSKLLDSNRHRHKHMHQFSFFQFSVINKINSIINIIKY